ncbi:hypothetical protein D0Z07_7648 [Hyphodiscus hymeniophilus]|uniref:Ricin B lectin domain-containing protein n=1 Tax=Hyphodiscus hymeniophilus TaxID=353542 RepID=A0A9P7AUC6_9HELO|nr:hypothetical protein D0Z07_7648 [Hyphodiscus hymeniophilus]
MANFDTNSWYHLGARKSSLAGTGLYDHGKGAVFATGTNASDPQQLWQFFPYNSTYYVLRTKASGQFGYMSAAAGANETTPGDTVPTMLNVTLADDSMFWTISPWGDGTFYFTNAANGTAWHLNVKPNGLLSMNSNITAPQTGQRFSYTQAGSIDNAAFSSVSAWSTASSTSTGASPSITLLAPSQSTASRSSSGLSTGAKAGIGAGVAVLAVLALAAVGFWLLRRRKQHQRSQAHPASFPLTKDYSHERKPTMISEAPDAPAPRFSDVPGKPQELDPGTAAARYEMAAEAGDERRRKGRSVSPFRPGVDSEQKAVMPHGLGRENAVYEMDAGQGEGVESSR